MDAEGKAYIAGSTLSSDFPVTANAFQQTNRSVPAFGESAIVAKFGSPAPRGGTTLTLTSFSNPQLPGRPIYFRAKVTAEPGVGIPAGVITLQVDGATPIQGELNLAGEVGFQIGSLAEGPHLITANYQGNPGFVPSTSSITEAIR